MDHAAGVAVAVADKGVGHKVPDDRVHVHHPRGVLPAAQRLQRRDQANPVSVRNIGLRAVENVGVAVGVIVDILQLYIAAAHTAEPAAHTAHFRRRLPIFLRREPRRRRTAALGRRGETAGVSAWLRSAPEVLPAAVLQVLYRKAPAVPAPAAEAHTVGLVEVPGVPAVIALQKAVLNALHRQIQAPVLPVYRDIDKAAQRRGGPGGGHHLVGEEILHIGVILDDVVQVQLIQAVIGRLAVIVVEFDFEAVPVVPISGHGAEGRVPLGPDAHVPAGFPVDDHRAGRILLVLAGVDKAVPIVHHDVHRMDPAGSKEPVFIAHGPGCRLEPQGLAVDKQQRDRQRQRQDQTAEPVDVSVRRHSLTPCSRRCS